MARESTAMMTPPWKMKPSVVVPWQGLTISTTSRSKVSICAGEGARDQARASAGCGGGQLLASRAAAGSRGAGSDRGAQAGCVSAGAATHVLDGGQVELLHGHGPRPGISGPRL